MELLSEETQVPQGNFHFKDDDSKRAELLTQYGIDAATLRQADTVEQVLKNLLQVAQIATTAETEDLPDTEIEYVRWMARTRIYETLRNNHNSVKDLFKVVRHYEGAGIGDIEVLIDIYRRVHGQFSRLSNTPDITEDERQEGHDCASILNEFDTIARHIRGADLIPKDANYLTDRSLDAFSLRILSPEAGLSDPDDILPIQIDRNRIAMFAENRNELYIVDQSSSQEYDKKWGIYANDPDNELAFLPQTFEELPDELRQALLTLVNKSTQITTLPELAGIKPEEIYSYLSLLRSEIRLIVEHEFRLLFVDLTLREQIHFLNYLKNTTVAEAETVQHFTHIFKVAGMRTFLSLEREGSQFGRDIIGFATEHPKTAAEVFESYGQLLDEATKLEHLITDELDCTAVDCVEIIEAARKRLLDETHQYLKDAISGGEVSAVNLISVEIARARALSAMLGAAVSAGQLRSIESFKSFKSEIINGQDVGTDLLKKMCDAQTQNYTAYGYSTENIETLNNTLSENITKEGAKVYVWRVGDGTVLASCLVQENRVDKEVFISGLNINPDLKEAKAGKGIIDQLLQDYYEQGWKLKAEASPKNAEGYAEIGFVATDRNDDELGEELYMLDMELAQGWDFHTKKERRGQLLSHITEKDRFVSSDRRVIVWRTDDPAATPRELGVEYVITRKFRKRDTNGNEQYVFVLEKPDPSWHISTEPQKQIAA